MMMTNDNDEFNYPSLGTDILLSLYLIITIVPDKMGYPHIFSYFCTKTYVEYSSEVSQQGTSNEYLQHMFLYRSKKNIGTFQFISL